jgi:NitT/TauT family transport system substrate-binding protein
MKVQNGVFRLAMAGLMLLTALLSGCRVVAPGVLAKEDAMPATLRIYAPATPSSVPVLLAAEQMENAEVTIFTDHAQAHTLFLRGDVDVLVTGLSVGVEFVAQGVPVQIVNSYVAGLTYLVTRDLQIADIADLQGHEVVLPFEGSPIEQVTRYFVEASGLTWGEDVVPAYSPFPSSVEMLKAGKVQIVALPEPFVSQVAGLPSVEVALSYAETWNALANSSGGYPQVGVFVHAGWATEHGAEIEAFNRALEDAVTIAQQEPVVALAAAQSVMQFPPEILTAALARTSFAPHSGAALEQQVRGYYDAIGESLDGTYESFFYRP